MTKTGLNKKADLLSLISNKIYGEIPKKPVHLSYKTALSDPNFAAGRATLKNQLLVLELENSEITIPFTSIIPNDRENCPAIVNIGFKSDIPNVFLPAEEIIQRGYSVFHISIDKLSDDNDDFKSGISSAIAKSRRKKNAPGKAMIWSWAAMRVIDHIYDLESICKEQIVISGHKQAAISALICAGLDERIGYVITNDPYASFAGLPYTMSATEMSHLFCPSYPDEPMPDTIEPLISLCQGKTIMLGSAMDRPFADVESEYRMLMKISKQHYHPINLIGLSNNDETITPPCRICGDKIYYHARSGTEYFSRDDWNNYLDFIDSKINKKP